MYTIIENHSLKIFIFRGKLGNDAIVLLYRYNFLNVN